MTNVFQTRRTSNTERIDILFDSTNTFPCNKSYGAALNFTGTPFAPSFKIRGRARRSSVRPQTVVEEMKMKDVSLDAQMRAVMSVFCNESNFRHVCRPTKSRCINLREGRHQESTDTCSMCSCLGIETTAGRCVTSSKPTRRTSQWVTKTLPSWCAFRLSTVGSTLL